MSQNKNNKRPPNDKRNRNLRGIISLVCWALLLTSLFTYATDYMGGSGKASSVEIMYSEYQDMVVSGQVEIVDFDNTEAVLIVTPKDGFSYTDEDGVTYTKSGVDEDGNSVYTVTGDPALQETTLEFFTVQIESNDAVVAFLQEHGGGDIEINEDYQAPMGPFMLLLTNMPPIPRRAMTFIIRVMTSRMIMKGSILVRSSMKGPIGA